MDIRTRFVDKDPDEILATIVDAVRSQIYTALPVRVAQDSADGHTVNLTSTIQAVQRNPDGTQSLVSLPMFMGVPIHHTGGGGVTVTHQHTKDDEGLVVFSSRSMDAWFQQGGEQKQVDARMHDLSDGVYLPGVRSNPRKLQGVSTNSTQTRTDDKKSLHDVSHSAITAIRELAAHQINAAAIQAQLKGASHIVDAMSIQHIASKILLNC
jgi:hypothetical protein